MYRKYLCYVIKHKWYVMLECFKFGLYWQGVTHDTSKLLPCEFRAYASRFYGSIQTGRDESGYYNATETGSDDFTKACHHHQAENKHHWQYWTIPKDVSSDECNYTIFEEVPIKAIEIPSKYIKEMVCDWLGAGKAQMTKDEKKLRKLFITYDDKYYETRKWYSTSRHKMLLHPNSRKKIEEIIEWRDLG